MEPFLSLRFHEPRPGGDEIVRGIAAQLAAGGEALAGCRLPPIRVLAHQLGVSKNTVSVAYDELKARGLVESRSKRGLYVAAQKPSSGPVRAASARAPAPALKAAAPLPSFASPASRPLGLSTAFIDPRLLPRERLGACFRAALKRPGLVDFADLRGFLPLRRAIAERLRRRGIDAQPEHIITTVGSQHALDVVVRSLRSRVVATENPAYYVGKALLERSDAEVIGLPVDPFSGVDLGAWEARLTERRPSLVYLTTRFQNPTGYSYTSGELARLLSLSASLGFGVLEDDWGSEMLSYSEFRPSLRALGGGGVLYMNSFTKKLLPSLRVGYLLGDESTVPSLLTSKRVSVGSAPHLGEAALYEFLESGYYDAHLRSLQAELDRRYRRTLELLRQVMPEPVRWTSPGGGPLLWVGCPGRVDLAALAARMAQRGVQISLSTEAFFGEPHLHGFRLGYAYLAPAEMEEALGVLGEELRRSLDEAPARPAVVRAAPPFYGRPDHASLASHQPR